MQKPPAFMHGERRHMLKVEIDCAPETLIRLFK